MRFEIRDYIYGIGGLSRRSADALGLPETVDENINDLSFTTGLSFVF